MFGSAAMASAMRRENSNAIDGERVACRYGGFIRDAQKSGTCATHLLFQEAMARCWAIRS